MKAINDTYLQNKDEILDTLKRDKPAFGWELGEITLNELIVKGSCQRQVVSPAKGC